jgi:putative endonuclease
MFYVYVLRSASGILYKGSTADLEARIKTHNSTSGNRFTSKDQPWVLVYSELHNSRADAMKREKFLKSGKGREFLKTVL